MEEIEALFNKKLFVEEVIESIVNRWDEYYKEVFNDEE